MKSYQNNPKILIMGASCIKTQDLPQFPPTQIDFHAFFKKLLISPTGDFFDLLKFLTQNDVTCLTYLVKALFHPSLNQKVFKFVQSLKNQIDYFGPPSRLIKLAQQKANKTNQKDSITKLIVQTSSLYPNTFYQKDVDQVFSRSSCPIQNIKEDKCDEHFSIENSMDLKQKQRQIEERLEKLSEALRGAEKAYQIQRSLIDHQSQSRLNQFQSQCPSSFMSKESLKISPHKTMANIKQGNEKMFATSFHSGSPKNHTIGNITLKKTNTTKQNVNQKSENIELKSNYSKGYKMEENADEILVVDKYLQIKQFYEQQIAKYKQELQYLRNRLSISQKEKQSSGISSSNFNSLLSKQSEFSNIYNRKKVEIMKICSAQVNQQIKEQTVKLIEYGTKMSELKESDSEPENESESEGSNRKHAKSIIIRLFRDSKMFPIEYSKKSSPVKFVQMREKIEGLFISFYTQEIYRKNPIELTNMIFLFEDRQPKRYYDYLKNYKSWLLIGKVNQNLYIGAYINMKEGPKSSTMESFLFSMTKQGKPYILRAKTKITDPINKPQYINFGDSEFRIKSGTKTVCLSLQNIRMSFQEEDGNEPNTRRFSMNYGQNVEFQQLQIHEVVFSEN